MNIPSTNPRNRSRSPRRPRALLLALALPFAASGVSARAAHIWVEGESPSSHSMNRHPWWYDQVKKDQLSGGDYISNFHETKKGAAEYRFDAPEAGEYTLWVRANPTQTKQEWSLNNGSWKELDNTTAIDITNIAADNKPDLRFVAWFNAGKVSLRRGGNTLAFRFTSKNNHHGSLDCFLLTTAPITPNGALNPDQLDAERARAAAENAGWTPFDPGADPGAETELDLRSLNETNAGDGGFIAAKDGQFVHSRTGKPVRFWAVNGPPELKTREDMRALARLLARRGVNLVRAHGAVADPKTGAVKPERIEFLHMVVEEMKAEGIYTHLSIYFPLWFTPAPGTPGFEGYDGKTHPFASLMFNPKFQDMYRTWARALLTTRGKSGRALLDEPAVFGLEIQNEDSFLFWTFSPERIPDPQLRILEGMFADWLKKKHGSLSRATAAWNGLSVPRDNPAQNRMGFRPLFNIFTDRTPRDQDTARFLAETQRKFYDEMAGFLRKLGFKGLVCASNWTTANNAILGPLEKWSYAGCDFIDRHGYFGCHHQGENAAWSVRDGHTYRDRSAHRFEAEEPGKPHAFAHPINDPEWNGLPSMVSEIAWNRPNRFRTEGPLFMAAFGALQESDAIVQFALDGNRWTVKPNFWMQPWTILSPAAMGQSPAAALIYRLGLVEPGGVLAEVDSTFDDAAALKGLPLVQEASLDELRKADVTGAKGPSSESAAVHPLVFYAGRTKINIGAPRTGSKAADLAGLVDTEGKRVTSSHKQVALDYGRGLLTVNAPAAQAASGPLGQAGLVDLQDITVESPLELGCFIAASLDGQPLATAGRILLQAMSEEKTTGFQTKPAGGSRRIASIGKDPWLMREIAGAVSFKRTDAASLKVTALDGNGKKLEEIPGGAAKINLRPATIYYLIEK